MMQFAEKQMQNKKKKMKNVLSWSMSSRPNRSVCVSLTRTWWAAIEGELDKI